MAADCSFEQTDVAFERARRRGVRRDGSDEA
jgi:hypothetical protein